MRTLLARAGALVAAAGILIAASPAQDAPLNLLGIPGLTIGAGGIWTGVSMFAIYLIREWRETRKLSAADRLARREGYAKQVAGLQVENRRLRRELADDRKRHDDYRHACQHETDQLRTEIRGLEDQVTGFKRRLDAQASTLGRAVLGGFDAPSTEKRLSDDHVGDEK